MYFETSDQAGVGDRELGKCLGISVARRGGFSKGQVRCLWIEEERVQVSIVCRGNLRRPVN